jgi:hypothetical protein
MGKIERDVETLLIHRETKQEVRDFISIQVAGPQQLRQVGPANSARRVDPLIGSGRIRELDVERVIREANILAAA